EQRRVLFVEVVVGQRRTQGGRTLVGELLVEVGELFFEAVGTAFVFVVYRGHQRESVPERTTSSTASTVCSKVKSVESTTITPGAAVRKSTTWESAASRLCRAAATAAASCVVTSALRRAARTSGAAVRRMRTGASGSTTVVMSRPS